MTERERICSVVSKPTVIENGVVGINKLVPYAKNSRTHSEKQIEQIAASIAEFGFVNPVLVWKKNEIIAGHGRVLAAKRLLEQDPKRYAHLGELPVRKCDHLTDVQRRALVIADNKLALNAGWDNTILSEELTALMPDFSDLGIIGFTEIELRDLLPAAEDLTDEDSVPAVQSRAVSCAGDIWELGEHKLMCGDSTSCTDVATLMGRERADMWLTDPPYNVAYEGKTKDALKIVNDNMSDEKFRAFLRDACVAADAVMRPGAVFYIWHADSEGYNFRGACKDTGWVVRQCVIWKKQSMILGRQDYHWQHEPCLYGWKSGASHKWSSNRKQTTILEFDKPSRNGEHPTMKPVALFEYQMLNNTDKGDIVLDSFGGSGTTLIAAEKNERIARIMELDPIYVDVIIRRWEQLTGRQAVHSVTKKTFASCECGRGSAGPLKTRK